MQFPEHGLYAVLGVQLVLQSRLGWLVRNTLHATEQTGFLESTNPQYSLAAAGAEQPTYFDRSFDQSRTNSDDNKEVFGRTRVCRLLPSH